MTTRSFYNHGEFSWVDLSAHDMERTKAFYEPLFGWTSVAQDTSGGPPYSRFEVAGKGVAGLGQMPDEVRSMGIPPSWNSYINVDDIETTVAKAVELGATVSLPTMKVLDAGWLAFVMDPTGGNVGFWQKNMHFGAQLVNEPGGFCWNELATRDIATASDFYCQLFGWRIEKDNNSPSNYHIIYNQDRPNGAFIGIEESWGEFPPQWLVYFTVNDADATIKKAELLGGKVCGPVMDIPEVGRFAMIADPDGAMFYAMKMHDPPE